jgi:hypothetical protein
VKDWIAADFETWETVLNNEGTESYRVTVSEQKGKDREQKRKEKS